MMPFSRISVFLLCCLLSGCAMLSDKHKMEAYGRTIDSYETAMRISDFNVACQYMDPDVLSHEDCMQRYENVKIAGYNVNAAKVAEDKQKVDLKVELSYFLLDRYVVNKIKFEQSWQYEEKSKAWLLKTVPPDFK
ncbi:hypothetical protein [uncultured Desulfosarcina sp.]|uniref:hypothetical protein n=1 Tax=uncultured Desulfosarcina sp. TaxID=218289 RepID=UPI0029C74DFE|nr:hypothetical protein [uncultured Desulfosarcina sp.]